MLRKYLASFLLLTLLLALAAGRYSAASTYDYFVPLPLAQQTSYDGNIIYNAGLPALYVMDQNPTDKVTRVPSRFSRLSLTNTVSANFTITYLADAQTDTWGERCYPFPEPAKAALSAAAGIWASLVNSSVPISLRVCWANLGSTLTIGYSGSTAQIKNFANAPRSNTWYQKALANALAGVELEPGSFDMELTYNGYYAWYYGMDGNTPSSQLDFMTVVLHEITHGLNFSTSIQYSSGYGAWGNDTGYPNIYDTFLVTGAGRQLIDTSLYGNPSIVLGSALSSGDLWFNGSNAMAANGGQRVKIYAPSTFSPGASISHLDYSTFAGTANGLMAYALAQGRSIHDPGPVTLGVLKDLGWPVPKQPLTVGKSGSGGGTVTSTPAGIQCGNVCSGVFTGGSRVTLTAQAANDSVFVGWGGACTGTVNCQITMSQARTVVASFNLQTVALTVDKLGTGTGKVSSTPAGIDCGSTCGGMFTKNTTLTLTAQAANDSVFVGWGGACSGMANCLITMDQAKTVSAAFEKKVPPSSYRLTVNDAGSGTGTVNSIPAGIRCGSICQAEFRSGKAIRLIARAVRESVLAGWSGACSGMGPCLVRMDQDRQVTAHFAVKTYRLSVVRTGNGSIIGDRPGIACGNQCVMNYPSGTRITLTAQPSEGGLFKRWGGDCAAAGRKTSCTVNMNRGHGVRAIFQ
ncbi:MAG: hypothetical protein PHE55_03240 [Methylococcaceae bacterium]|nr:hypothetical protein [Methylococcaceae bacterium]